MPPPRPLSWPFRQGHSLGQHTSFLSCFIWRALGEAELPRYHISRADYSILITTAAAAATVTPAAAPAATATPAAAPAATATAAARTSRSDAQLLARRQPWLAEHALAAGLARALHG